MAFRASPRHSSSRLGSALGSRLNSDLSDILQLPLPSPTSILRPLDAPVISALGNIVDLTGSAPFLQLVEVADLVGKPDEVFANMNDRHFRGLVVILHERLDGGGFLIPKDIWKSYVIC